MATDPQYRLLTAEEFLAIDFGSDMKAELDNGVIRMMAGGPSAHARVQMNVATCLRTALRGSGCRPFGSDMAVRSGNRSVRYPDISVFCGDQSERSNDRAKSFDDPRVVVEILSASTARVDQGVKLDEYREIATIETIVFVDPDSERIRVVTRTAPEDWTDNRLPEGADLVLPSLGIILPHVEIFARD